MSKTQRTTEDIDIPYSTGDIVQDIVREDEDGSLMVVVEITDDRADEHEIEELPREDGTLMTVSEACGDEWPVDPMPGYDANADRVVRVAFISRLEKCFGTSWATWTPSKLSKAVHEEPMAKTYSYHSARLEAAGHLHDRYGSVDIDPVKHLDNDLFH